VVGIEKIRATTLTNSTPAAAAAASLLKIIIASLVEEAEARG
jgi:hypothetical protein